MNDPLTLRKYVLSRNTPLHFNIFNVCSKKSRVIIIPDCQTDYIYNHLGCFYHNSFNKEQALKNLKIDSWNNMTHQVCFEYCESSGNLYAGLNSGHGGGKCYCGDYIYTDEYADYCKTQCAGNPVQICGGYYGMNIFDLSLVTYTTVPPQNEVQGQSHK